MILTPTPAERAMLEREGRATVAVPVTTDTIYLNGYPASRVVTRIEDVPGDFPWPKEHAIQWDNGYFHLPVRPHPSDPQAGEHWTRDRFWPSIGIGTRHGVGEEWAVCCSYDHCDNPSIHCGWNPPDLPCAYRDIDPYEFNERGRWRAADTMPKWAVRQFVTVTALHPPERRDDGWYWVAEVER